MTVNLEKLLKYWEFIVTIFGLVTALIYFLIENKIANETIQKLQESNTTLTIQVAKLETKTDMYEQNKNALENSVQLLNNVQPGVIKKRVDELEKEVFGFIKVYNTYDTQLNKINFVAPPKLPR